jgi:hypothetical protein
MYFNKLLFVFFFVEDIISLEQNIEEKISFDQNIEKPIYSDQNIEEKISFDQNIEKPIYSDQNIEKNNIDIKVNIANNSIKKKKKFVSIDTTQLLFHAIREDLVNYSLEKNNEKKEIKWQYTYAYLI